MQVDPIRPTLKAPGTMRLKPKCVKLLSSFAFKSNMRRYGEVLHTSQYRTPTARAYTPPLLSLT